MKQQHILQTQRFKTDQNKLVAVGPDFDGFSDETLLFSGEFSEPLHDFIMVAWLWLLVSSCWMGPLGLFSSEGL